LLILIHRDCYISLTFETHSQIMSHLIVFYVAEHCKSVQSHNSHTDTNLYNP
jgi:hypothetical protein